MAMNKLQILNNFLKDPYKARSYALNAEYMSPPVGGSRLAQTAVCRKIERVEIVNAIQAHIPPVDRLAATHAEVLFRYTLENTVKKAICHVDHCAYAGVLCLTLPEFCKGGTSFYRHLPTGDKVYREENRHLYDFDDPSQWEEVTKIEMKFNRLILYPGQWFHAITPIFYGNSIENARLTQNIFIYSNRELALQKLARIS